MGLETPERSSEYCPKVRHRPGSIEPQEGVTPVQAGLTAGSVAAVVAVLANLPLEAPTDTYFNSAPVMAGALAVGLGAGVFWRALDGRGRRPVILLVSMTLAFGLVTVAAVAGETQLERSVSYIVPLAAIVFGLTGALTLLLLRARVSLPRWVTAMIGAPGNRPRNRIGRPGRPGERPAGASPKDHILCYP